VLEHRGKQFTIVFRDEQQCGPLQGWYWSVISADGKIEESDGPFSEQACHAEAVNYIDAAVRGMSPMKLLATLVAWGLLVEERGDGEISYENAPGVTDDLVEATCDVLLSRKCSDQKE
jgi:hypothetical protein